MISLTEQVLKIRDECLNNGIPERDFWDMTLGEAVRACDAGIRRRKTRARFDYAQAMTVGLFVASMFSSKAPPKIETIYPELFPQEEQKEAEEEQRMRKSEANFLKFAYAFNKRFENGNGKPESKNNS